MEKIRYSVKDIKEMMNVGNNRAYEIANSLPHTKEGKNIYIYKQHWNEFINNELSKAILKNKIENKSEFSIRKII